MIRKHAALLLICICTVCAFAGCTSVGQPLHTSSAPAQEQEVFYTAGQPVTGGSAVDYASFHAISLKKNGKDTVITLEFSDERQIDTHLTSVPAFRSGSYPDLQRLWFTFQHVNQNNIFMDAEGMEGTPVAGIFSQASSDGSSSTLFIHITKPITYRVEEDKNLLHIVLRTAENASQTETIPQWYIQVGCPDSMITSSSMETIHFSPALCADGTQTVWISNGFENKEDAQQYLTEIKSTLEKLLPDQSPVLVEIMPDTLPQVQAPQMSNPESSTDIAFCEGKQPQVDVMIPNGRFLTWFPDNSRYLFVRQEVIPGVDARADYFYEQLYIGEPGKEPVALLPEMEFSSISTAGFSADGRYLAFLDYLVLRRCLLVYDTQTQQLLDGESIGFGYDTPSFTWHDSLPILYGITGNGESLELTSVTLQNGQMQDSWKYTSIVMDVSRLGYYNGCVYFVKFDETANTNYVYALDPATEQITQIMDGMAFCIDATNGNIAVLNKDNAVDESTTTQIKIMNLPTLSTWLAAEKSDIVDMHWSASGEKLICQTYLNNNVDNTYQIGISVYDNSTHTMTERMQTISGQIMPARKEDTVLLNVIDTQEDRPIPITFAISLE